MPLAQDDGARIPGQQSPFLAFVRFHGIECESSDAGHKGCAEGLSFNWGVHQPSDASAGDHERADFSDFTVTKVVDAGSAALYSYCAGGTEIAQVNVEVCTWIGHWSPILLLTLFNAMISGIDLLGTVEASGAPRPIERVSVRYSKVAWEVCIIGHGGKRGPTRRGGWDLEENESWIQG